MLKAAADILESLACAAAEDMESNGYFAGTTEADWREGVDGGLGGPAGELAAVFSPHAALELSRWLRDTARQETYSLAEFGHCSASPHSVALARDVTSSGGE